MVAGGYGTGCELVEYFTRYGPVGGLLGPVGAQGRQHGQSHRSLRTRGEGAGFRSLTEAVDATTAAGRMLMQMGGAFAEFERSMIRERTRAGLEAARENGRTGGRPRKLNARRDVNGVRTGEELTPEHRIADHVAGGVFAMWGADSLTHYPATAEPNGRSPSASVDSVDAVLARRVTVQLWRTSVANLSDTECATGD